MFLDGSGSSRTHPKTHQVSRERGGGKFCDVSLNARPQSPVSAEVLASTGAECTTVHEHRSTAKTQAQTGICGRGHQKSKTVILGLDVWLGGRRWERSAKIAGGGRRSRLIVLGRPHKTSSWTSIIGWPGSPRWSSSVSACAGRGKLRRPPRPSLPNPASPSHSPPYRTLRHPPRASRPKLPEPRIHSTPCRASCRTTTSRSR